MEAANRGHLAKWWQSIGLFHRASVTNSLANPYISPDLSFNFKYFFIA